MGVERLRVHLGVETGIVTREASGFAVARARKLALPEVLTGVADKGAALVEVAGRRGLAPDEIAFVGDDVNDLPALALAGLAACPSDAFPAVKAAVHHVCTLPGGHGAFREVAEIVLFARLGETPTTP